MPANEVSLIERYYARMSRDIDTSKNYLEDCWRNGRHTRHWVDKETGADMGEARYVPSHKEFLARKNFRAKLLAALKPLTNTKFTNKKSGVAANFSVGTINKLGSDKAVNKSVVNGYSAAEHFEAAAKIKRLYEDADFVGRFPDDRKNPNVLAMYRFQISIQLSSGRNAYAYITTKEVREHGNRVYTLELMAAKYPQNEK